MATPAQIKAAVNARLATLWLKIKTRQETYAQNHGGRYWQGILLAVPPDDGALCVADFSKAPTDQFTSVWSRDEIPVETRTYHSWAWAGFDVDLPASVEASFQIDVYEAPGGHRGYFCTAFVTKAGITYTRTAQVEDGVEITTGNWSS